MNDVKNIHREVHVGKGPGRDGRYVASCSKECGWVGKPKPTEQAALDEHADHETYALYAEGG